MNYNPLSPEVMKNPFPYYTELRNEAPVAWIEPLQGWALSRYADVDFALRNPQIFSSSEFTKQTLGELNPVPDVPWILDMNPPDHTRIRKLANKGFLPRIIRSLEPRVQEITRQLIASLRSQTEGDLVAKLSGPLPTTVIAEMLGVETERVDDMYFGQVAGTVLERIRTATAEERGRIGRDIYTYMHLPIIAGIVLVAVGDELVIADPTDDLHDAGALVALGGPALFLGGLMACSARLGQVQSLPRVVAVVALLVAVPLGAGADGLVVSALTTALLAVLVVVERCAARTEARGRARGDPRNRAAPASQPESRSRARRPDSRARLRAAKGSR